MKRLVLVAAALTCATPVPADAAVLRVSPTTVPAGGIVRVSGSVAGVCGAGDSVTIFSRAFSLARQFAGVPAIYARVRANGTFLVSTVIPVTRASAGYSLGARCGGGPFGQATLRVTRSPFVAASPALVSAGGRVRVFGSVRSACPAGDSVTLFSRAFGSRQSFAGVPAILARIGPNGVYSTSTVIPAARTPALYSIGARCGGGNVGSASLRVS